MLIMALKSPKVRKIIGKEMMFKTGLTRALINPKTAPAMKKSTYVPVKTKPGTRRLAAQMAAELAKIRIIRLIGSWIKLILAYQLLSIWSTSLEAKRLRCLLFRKQNGLPVGQAPIFHFSTGCVLIIAYL